jgi:hypothetical protein
MAKVKNQPALQEVRSALSKKSSRSRLGKIPDVRADVPFDDDIEGNNISRELG